MTVPQIVLTGEVLPPAEGMVHVIGRPHPLRDEVRSQAMPSGLSIAEMLAIAVPSPARRRLLNVSINGDPIAREWWPRIRPKAGTTVNYRAWVRGGGIGRALAMIAILAVAVWAGPAGAGLLAGAGLIGGAGTAGFIIAAGAIQAGVSLVGSLLINAIAPPPTPGRDGLGVKQESLPGIRGSQNRATPYEAIPLVLGQHFMTPPLGAEHYSESVGDEQYVRSLFVLGYGPLRIEDIKIGDTPIEDYDDVEIEIREGWASDAPLKLYPSATFQEDLSVELTKAASWQTRTTAPDVDEALVDTVAPQGIGRLSKKGKWKTARVMLRVMYRKTGAGVWWDGGLIVYEERLPRTRRRTQRVKFPERGQYEVRVRRLTDDAPEEPEAGTQYLDTVVWAALRSVRNDPPVQSPISLAMIAIRIKATDQLNGVIDDLNCIVTSIIPDWNGTAWVRRPTRNVASIYRHLFTGPHLRTPVALSRIDLDTLQRWHGAGYTCDAVIQGQRTLFDAAKDVAACGRAAFMMVDGLYSVRRDVEQTIPVQMITPRNIIALQGQRVFPDPPHALRVQFISSAAGYQMDEIIVYADGYNAANAQTFETLDLWGITTADRAFKEARYHMAVAKLRPETLIVRMDFEHLVARPGGLVRVAHDVMLVGIAQCRVTNRQLSGTDCISITVDEDCPMEAGKEYTVYIRRHRGVSSSDLLEVARRVETVAGVNRTLTFITPIEEALRPERDDLVAFGEVDRVVENWIVKSVEPDTDLQATLTLVPHAPAVHTADQGPIPDYRPRTTIPIHMRRPQPPRFVRAITGDAALDQLPNGDLVPRIIATIRLAEGWQHPPISRVIAHVRRASGGDWTADAVTVEGLHRIVVREVQPGERYEIRARAMSDFGKLSRWAVQTAITAIGAEQPPGNLDGLALEIHGSGARLTWLEPPDVDVAYYLIRHSKATSGATWADAVTLPRAPARATSVSVPLMVGTYMVKIVDNQGRTSATAAAVSTTVPGIANLNFIEDLDAHPTFAGTKVNTLVDGGLGGLRLDSVAGEEFIAEIQTGMEIEVQTGVPLVVQATPTAFFATGSWEHAAANAIDLGGVFTCLVRADLEVLAADLNDDIYQWADVYAVEDVYGGATELVTVRAFVATTDDEVDGSEVWGDWREFVSGEFAGRGFRFRLVLESTSPGVTPIVTDATFVVDMPDRVWSAKNVAIASGGTHIDFDPPFFVEPAIGVTVKDGATGERIAVTNADADGFDLRVFTSGGSGIARTVDILAKAYGERE